MLIEPTIILASTVLALKIKKKKKKTRKIKVVI
jgi:hypothetical protein